MMGISRLSEQPTSDLHALYRDTKKMSTFKYPDTRTVGFIGDSGVGMEFQCYYTPVFILIINQGKAL
jgi:hypothetical protein